MTSPYGVFPSGPFDPRYGQYRNDGGVFYPPVPTRVSSAEEVRDIVGAALRAGTNVSIVVDDTGDTITISATGGGGGTSYTDEQVRDVIGTALRGVDGATVEVDDTGDTITIRSKNKLATLDDVSVAGAAVGKVVSVTGVDGQGKASYGLTAPGAADPSVAVAAQRGRWPVIEIATTNAAPIVDKDNYVTATYSITDTDGNALHAGTLRVKGRGNSTWDLPKKPYRLNLDSSTALLGMTAVQKNWALLANHFDPAKVNNGLALTIGQRMPGLTWTPQFRYVELILNGDFLGVYMLADLVRLESGRLPGAAANADTGDALTGTYLLEITNKERSTPGSDPGWNTSQGVWIIYDTPETPTAAQTSYIQGFINDFETALYGANFADPTTGYAPFIDSTSFADWYLVNELMMNGDSWFWSSCKLHKTPTVGGTPGRLRMGPLWDFDLSMGLTSSTPIGPTGYRTRLNHPSGTGPNWYDRLFRDAAFVDLVRDRWVLMRDTVLPDVAPPAWIDRQIDRLDPAILRDGRRWTQTVYTPQQAHSRKRFFERRAAWLDPLLTAPASPIAATVAETV